MEVKNKMYTSTMFLRPRVNGSCVPIAPGTPFDGNILDEHTREAYIRVGTLKEYVEPVKSVEPKAEVVTEELPTVEQVKSEEVLVAKTKKGKKAKEAPKGIFKLTVEELVDKDLSELDAIHADICAENGLPAPDLFASVEQAIEKLTSQA